MTLDQNKEGLIAKLIEWSVNNKFLVIVFTIALIALGIWALTTTKVDAIPDLSDVQVIIMSEYEGQASPPTTACAMRCSNAWGIS